MVRGRFSAFYRRARLRARTAVARAAAQALHAASATFGALRVVVHTRTAPRTRTAASAAVVVLTLLLGLASAAGALDGDVGALVRRELHGLAQRVDGCAGLDGAQHRLVPLGQEIIRRVARGALLRREAHRLGDQLLLVHDPLPSSCRLSSRAGRPRGVPRPQWSPVIAVRVGEVRLGEAGLGQESRLGVVIGVRRLPVVALAQGIDGVPDAVVVGGDPVGGLVAPLLDDARAGGRGPLLGRPHVDEDVVLGDPVDAVADVGAHGGFLLIGRSRWHYCSALQHVVQDMGA
nr:MAG TPA: hypothetical protein [Caudoviricetes sp.]